MFEGFEEALKFTLETEGRIGITLRIVEFSREEREVRLVALCPYCRAKQYLPLELSLAPKPAVCSQCHKLFIHSFNPKGDKDELARMLQNVSMTRLAQPGGDDSSAGQNKREVESRE